MSKSSSGSFTDEVYERVRRVFRNHTFGQWDTSLRRLLAVDMPLLTPSGPNPRCGAHLGGFRSFLVLSRDSNQPKPIRPVVANSRGAKEADLILTMARAGEPTDGWRERAAALKILRHLYLVRQVGAHSTWFYSPPFKYKKWAFEELEGTEHSVYRKLADIEEVHSESYRTEIADALTRTEAIARFCLVRMMIAPEQARDIAKRWFDDGKMSERQVEQLIVKLRTGFTDIARSLGNSPVVISSFPSFREKAVASTYAGGEGKFPVIYYERDQTARSWPAYSEMLPSGLETQRSQADMMAHSLLHEMAHNALGLGHQKGRRHKGEGYLQEGAKPGRDIARRSAIKHTDSWAYFGMDMANSLQPHKRQQLLN